MTNVVNFRKTVDSDRANPALEMVEARERVRWALEHLPGPFAVSTSFGAQAAVTLHLLTSEAPEIPVVFVDTGYLFREAWAVT